MFTGNSNWTLSFKYYLEMAIKELLKRNAKISDSGSCGGYSSRFRVREGEPLVLEFFPVGEFVLAKAPDYSYSSWEKAFRLNLRYHTHQEVTSAQSANPADNEYAGAILCEGGMNLEINSFGGLLPQYDTYLAVMQSCIRDVLGNKEKLAFKDIPRIYLEKSFMIESTVEETELMTNVIYFISKQELKDSRLLMV